MGHYGKAMAGKGGQRLLSMSMSALSDRSPSTKGLARWRPSALPHTLLHFISAFLPSLPGPPCIGPSLVLTALATRHKSFLISFPDCLSHQAYVLSSFLTALATRHRSLVVNVMVGVEAVVAVVTHIQAKDAARRPPPLSCLYLY